MGLGVIGFIRVICFIPVGLGVLGFIGVRAGVIGFIRFRSDVARDRWVHWFLPLDLGAVVFFPVHFRVIEFIRFCSDRPRGRLVYSCSFCSFRWAYGSLISFGFVWFIPVGLGVVVSIPDRLVHSGGPRGRWDHLYSFGPLRWA